jgi:hypothetical protein
MNLPGEAGCFLVLDCSAIKKSKVFMGGDKEFFGEEIVRQKVEQLWTKVFESSNKVLHQHKVFGYTGIAVIPSPSIEERIFTLQVFSTLIDFLLNADGKVGVDLDYDQTRQLLNAKSQITTMEQLAAALKANNRQDYDVAVAALERQAVF